MKKTTLLAVAMSTAIATAAYAEPLKIGVSWSNFQEERWKTDEAAIKAALDASKLSITDIFRFPVLGDLAKHLEAKPGAPGGDDPEAAGRAAERAAARSDAMSRRRAMRANRQRG